MELDKLRDGLVKCFLEVQGEFIEQARGKKSSKEFVLNFLKKAFEETGGNYENPNKKDFLKVVNWLIENAPAPRDIKKAKSHRKKIFALINSLEDEN